MNTYKTFDNSAAYRLESYKTKAKVSNETYKKYHNGELPYPYTWQKERWQKPLGLSRPSMAMDEDKSKWYVDTLNQGPFTLCGDADEFIKLDYTGWYCDSFQDDLARGAVVSIRNPKVTDEDGAHVQYLPATYHTEGDCTGIVYREFYDNKQDAARSADGFAERIGEECREYDAQSQAEQEIEDLKEELHALNKKTLTLVREIKTSYSAGLLPATCQAIHEVLEKAFDRRTAIFNRIEALNANYWLSTE